jgi:hypothetical protein
MFKCFKTKENVLPPNFGFLGSCEHCQSIEGCNEDNTILCEKYGRIKGEDINTETCGCSDFVPAPYYQNNHPNFKGANK